jgi:hypothetical protein
MKAAIDIDGTLTAHPGVVLTLANALRAAGWDVVFLTGCIYPGPGKADAAGMEADRRKQLAGYGADSFAVRVCVGRTLVEVATLKGVYCRDEDVHLLVDNDGLYCRTVRHMAPGTLVLRVEP